MLLQELANYRKRDTGLSMNIWIDGYQTYRKGKHYKKLKFQINKSNNIQKNNFGTISLYNCEIIDLQKLKRKNDFDLSENDIKGLKNFVKNNLFALNQIEDDILTESEFLSVIIKGKELADEETIDTKQIEVCDIIINNINENNYNDIELEEAQKSLLEIFSEKELKYIYNFDIKEV